MASAPFGNDPAKVARYRSFWARADVDRPPVGFTQGGWFPLDEFAPCRAWQLGALVSPDIVELLEGERCDDDIIRGAGPS
jgi:hypothetical protein